MLISGLMVKGPSKHYYDYYIVKKNNDEEIYCSMNFLYFEKNPRESWILLFTNHQILF